MKSRANMMVTTPLGRKRHFISFGEGDTYAATKAYNTPIQGGAAEVMLSALGRLPNLLAYLDARPIAVIHDEIILETSLQDAPQALKALEEAMTQGMLDVFPDASTIGLVEAKIASSWEEK
jgi:DNA polymerase-1